MTDREYFVPYVVVTERYEVYRDNEPTMVSFKTKKSADSYAVAMVASYPEYKWTVIDHKYRSN
jgi:hypothetical protein